MAAKELIENIKVELTCSICLGYFTEPVTAKCGHSFCQNCLFQCYEGDTLTCPECRSKIGDYDTEFNDKLKNLCISGKALRQHLLQSMVVLTTCDQHYEREKLFCDQDEKLICESCSLTEEHKDHQVLPLQMAVDQFKKKLQKSWNKLQENEQKLEKVIKKKRKSMEEFKENTTYSKNLVNFEYDEIHNFMNKEENESLQKLDQEINEELTKAEENEVFLAQQIQHLEERILEIEKMLDNPPLEMLQDLKGILERNEELLLQEPETIELNYTRYPMTGLTNSQEL